MGLATTVAMATTWGCGLMYFNIALTCIIANMTDECNALLALQQYILIILLSLSLPPPPLSLSIQDPFSPKVNYSLSLLLRSAPDVPSRELLVYNHPQNLVTLPILHGSKHFRVDYVIKPRPPVADVEYIKEGQTINVS